VLDTLLSIPVSLLPEFWRKRWYPTAGVDVSHGAFLSGLIEILICIPAFVVGYIFFLDANVKALGGEVVKRGAEEVLISEHVQFGMGIMSLGAYVLRPTTLLLMFFALDGVFRAFAAAITGESLATAPLALAGFVHRRIEARRAERALGPRVVDDVQKNTGACDLYIMSCRQKPWSKLTTIEYGDKMYELVEQRAGVPPRPYIYIMNLIPKNKLVRGLHHYARDEELTEKEKQEAAGRIP
jgi:hypothetical protein